MFVTDSLSKLQDHFLAQQKHPASASFCSRLILSVVVLVAFATLPLLSQTKKPSTPTGSVPTTFAGMSVHSPTSNYPPSGTDFGVLRLWDTPHTSWPALQSQANGSLDTTDLDILLATAYSNSVNNQAVVMYSFGQVPSFASSNPNDTNCAYAAGTCDPPSDLASNGSGSDLYWRQFITALAQHLAGLGPGHAPVVYFEPWNEVDRSPILANQSSNVSYNGTYAQLLRLTEDMRCILTGDTTMVIHNIYSVGSATQCSTSAWSQWGSQPIGIIPNAKIVSPSAHAQGSGYLTPVSIEKNFLHCDGANPPKSGSQCNWSLSQPWGSQAVDIINFHMKPGNEVPSGTDPESEMQTEYTHATSVYESPDTNKPLWNGEAGYSGNGWSPNGGDVSLANEPVQQAAFTARYMLDQWSLGIQNFDWYQWDFSNTLETGGTTNDAGTAFSTVAGWMIGATMTSSCGLVNGNGGPTGSLWSCTLQNGTWTGEVFWDTSTNYNCNSGSCLTYSYNVPPNSPNWHFYQTAIGSLTSIASPFTIQVSNLPTIIMTNRTP